MLRKLIFLFLVFLCYSADAQFLRRDVSGMPKISEPKACLDKASGWTFQDNGIWIEGDNKIPTRNSELNNSSNQNAKLGVTNFKSIQMREVIINGVQHVIMIIYSRDGEYEFNLLLENWDKYPTVTYYIFKASKLEEILPDTLTMNVPYAVNLDVFWMGRMVDYDKKRYLSRIANQIQKVKEGALKSPKTAIFAVLPVKENDKKYIRFRIIDVFNKQDIWAPYLLQKNEDKLFLRSYFETSYDKFAHFIRGLHYYPNLISNPKTYDDYLHRGLSFFDRKEYDAAIDDFQKAIEIEPETKNFLIFALLGSCYYRLEDYIQADKYFTRSLYYDPNQEGLSEQWAKSYFNRGMVRLKLKNKDDACSDFDQAAKYNIEEAEIMLQKKCRKWLKHNK